MRKALLFLLGIAVGVTARETVARVSLALGRNCVTFVITDPHPHKIQVIKEIRALTGFGLKDAKEASEGYPLTLEKESAAVFARELRKLGAAFTTTKTRRSQ